MNDLSDRALIDLPETRRFVWRDENDSTRDDILVDAINDVSDAITDYCEREFVPTTIPDRNGTDGVGNGTTTFVAASGAFTNDDVGFVVAINGTLYGIVSVTNATTVVLDAAVPTGTGLAWDFGEARTFDVTASGYVDLRPYDLRDLMRATLYADRADLDDQVLIASEYQFTRHAGGTAYDLQVIPPGYAPLHTGFHTPITIVGQWGMAEVPFSVKLAAKQWVKNIAENPGAYGLATMSGYAVTPDLDTITIAPAGMPTAVRYRLEPWRRGFEFR